MSQLINRILTSIILLFILYLSLINNFFLFLLLFFINFMTINEFNIIFKKIFKRKYILRFYSILSSIIYLTIFTLMIWLFLFNTNVNNKILLIFLLLICVSTDIGGFVFGKLLGGKKFTKISPNKTYTGVVGSFIFPIIFCYIFLTYFKELINIDYNITIFILIISFISQSGDLIISFFKRKANIKDTGNILPGHGGILDRIDGILFALPVGLILILY